MWLAGVRIYPVTVLSMIKCHHLSGFERGKDRWPLRQGGYRADMPSSPQKAISEFSRTLDHTLLRVQAAWILIPHAKQSHLLLVNIYVFHISTGTLTLSALDKNVPINRPSSHNVRSRVASFFPLRELIMKATLRPKA